jgi:release factor glutamine methyltransferase
MTTSDLRVTTTLSAWVADATTQLQDAGSPSPRVEAERLAAHALGVSWSDLWSRMREEVDASTLDGVLSRRVRGEPLAYIEGAVVFCSLEIACGPGVLVPRPETETLVDVALELIAEVASPVVCDVGTGSGAIAIAIGKQRADAQVWATDISAGAIAWAERNARAHASNIEFGRGDLLRSMPPRLRGGIDLVVSNPPYVPDGANLPADVGAEPPEALFAGPRGDEVLERLAREAPEWLTATGSLALEVGTPAQADRMASLLSRIGRTGIRRDATDRPRVVWMRRRRSI